MESIQEKRNEKIEKDGIIYILNAPILTSYGQYDFEKISIEVARKILRRPFVSAIGHESTALILTKLLGIPIPVNRIAIKMQPGDIAVVFRILTRLQEGKILTEEEIKKVPYEFSLLKREW